MLTSVVRALKRIRDRSTNTFLSQLEHINLAPEDSFFFVFFQVINKRVYRNLINFTVNEKDNKVPNPLSRENV